MSRAEKYIITTHLDAEALGRVDALAARRGQSRDEMIAALVASGLPICERAVAEAVANDEEPAVGLGWRLPAALLIVVAGAICAILILVAG